MSAAARVLGCAGILVRTGWPVAAEVEALADPVADGVLEAARWILGRTERADA
jgi:hypothetical protein